jgi:hypothetical protein
MFDTIKCPNVRFLQFIQWLNLAVTLRPAKAAEEAAKAAAEEARIERQLKKACARVRAKKKAGPRFTQCGF